MATEKSEILIRRNRMLLAKATEERAICREARARIYDTWQMANEVRQRAITTREQIAELSWTLPRRRAHWGGRGAGPGR